MVVIKVVSVDRLKKDFNDFETDKIADLSGDELDKLVESYVLKSFKGFKKGRIYDNPDLDDGIDSLNSLADTIERIYDKSNIKTVIASRKFIYMYKAYLSADQIIMNNLMEKLNLVHHDLINNLEIAINILNMLLSIYYDNYSNSAMLNDLMYKLSIDDDTPLTFEIHDKYVFGDEFSVNNNLMMDLDSYIKGNVDFILYLIENADNMFNDDLDADAEIDAMVISVRNFLKNLFSDADDFETVIISETELDNTLINRISIMKESLLLNEKYFELKKDFMDLYNGNAFKKLSEKRYEIYKENYGADTDFKEFMKKEPGYDLKECKFIKPEISGINLKNN